MKISIVAIGKIKQGPMQELCRTYRQRITWPIATRELEVRKKLGEEELKLAESTLITNALEKSSYIVAMDEGGQDVSSTELVRIIQHLQSEATTNLTFIIGGAFGLHESITKSADKRLAFGRATWPHQLVRVMLMEQIYRAQQIISKHPYHK